MTRCISLDTPHGDTGTGWSSVSHVNTGGLQGGRKQPVIMLLIIRSCRTTLQPRTSKTAVLVSRWPPCHFEHRPVPFFCTILGPSL